MDHTIVDNPWLRMAQNNAWANATLYAALHDLPDDAFAGPRPGFFPSLMATLNHIYEVDLYYLDALTEGGKGISVYRRAPVADAGTLGALQARSDARFIAFCASLTPERLAASVETERDGGRVSENVAALLLHLVQHQVHHRGQAHVQLSDAGIDPPQLDDFYLKYGRAPSAKTYW